jgi:hypothetical protein
MLSGAWLKIRHHFKNATTREYEVGVQRDFVQHNIHRCLDFMRIVAMSLCMFSLYQLYWGYNRIYNQYIMRSCWENDQPQIIWFSPQVVKIKKTKLEIQWGNSIVLIHQKWRYSIVREIQRISAFRNPCVNQ